MLFNITDNVHFVLVIKDTYHGLQTLFLLVWLENVMVMWPASFQHELSMVVTQSGAWFHGSHPLTARTIHIQGRRT